MYQKTMDLMMDPVKEGFREIWKGGGATKAALSSPFRTFPMRCIMPQQDLEAVGCSQLCV